VSSRQVKLLVKELKKLANPTQAKILQGFFKTGPGEYGVGDIFWGVTVPQLRGLTLAYEPVLTQSDIKKLLTSPVHEQRLLALLVLVKKFSNGSAEEQRIVFNFYLSNSRYINNWDLVDLSADKILGAYLWDKPKDILFRLAVSKNVWQRRLAILATFYFIKQGQSRETLRLSRLLLKDKHDLIHKSVGWMLREVGKRCSTKDLESFLNKYAPVMPRTMLRYALEKLPTRKRKKYLKLKH